MTNEEFEHEMLRCINNPVYFYNKYTTQGQQYPITHEVYNIAKDNRIREILKKKKRTSHYYGTK